MKEKIHTIPVIDAFQAGDECPFCHVEKKAQRHAIAFLLGPGASYMEEDIRGETDKTGFCSQHYKMMFDYGNKLGNALILSTHVKRLNQELSEAVKAFTPGKSSVFQRMKRSSGGTEPDNVITAWTKSKKEQCFVCNHVKMNYDRYMDTFFDMLKKQPEFLETVKSSKGFCLPHFGELMAEGEKRLNEKQKAELYPVLFERMQENMQRLQDEIDVFVKKFDYRSKDLPWGNSRDSIQRCMQKAAGGYPADEPFVEEK